MKSYCFHCGLPNPDKAEYTAVVLAEKRSFCCIGCLSIAETLSSNGLDDFYKFRDGKNRQASALVPSELEAINAFDSPQILAQISLPIDHRDHEQNHRSIELGIEGITCAACGWLIEQTMSNIDCVVEISVNVSTQRAVLKWSTEPKHNNRLSDIIKTFSQIGYKAYPFTEDDRAATFKNTNRQYIKRLAVASLGMMQVMTYALAVYIGDYQDIAVSHRQFFLWLSFIVTTPVVFYSAFPFFQSAWQNLRVKHLGMNFPVSLAILSTYLSSAYSLLFNHNNFYFDSVVMFTFFLLIGRFLEHRARYLSVLKQSNFRQRVPLSVKKISADEKLNENFKDILISHVSEGDKLIIPAGGIIPVDGILLEKTAEINEAVMTGEFLPVTKHPKDQLMSGSSNQSAALTMLVSKDFTHSKINQLIELQREAEDLKPNSLSIADKISHGYVTGLLIVLSVASLIWWFIDPGQMFDVALSILVVSCPCALSLATPAAFAAATSQLMDRGFMIRRSATLTEMSKVNHVIFDKTGTLTSGNISIKKITNYSNYSEIRLLKFAILLEEISSHPIASAFREVPEIKPSQFHSDNLSNKHEVIGQGVAANINEGRYLLGKVEFLIEHNKDTFKIDPLRRDQHNNEVQELKKAALKHKGMTVFLSENGKLIAAFELQDKIKTTAAACVKQLAQTCKVSILTGDTVSAAESVGRQLSISNIIANASPEEKLEAIKKAQKEGECVMMVGDGFNDLGALAAANVSISLVASSHLSKITSDAVLVSEDLPTIAEAITIARRVQSTIKQNLTWAIAYNLLAIPFAASGFIPPWLAAIGMSLSSLVVVLNSLRLRHTALATPTRS